MPTTISKKTSKKTTKKTKQTLFGRLKSMSKKGQLLAFVAVFALLGGGVYAFNTFASTNCPYSPVAANDPSYTVHLVINVQGVSCAHIDSGPNQFNNNGPAHDVGICGKSFNISGSLDCNGFKMGPYSLTAQTIPGYTFKWYGCDATSPSGNSCWEDQYTRTSGTRSVTLVYTPVPTTTTTTQPPTTGTNPQVYDASLTINVAGLASGQGITLASGPRAFVDSEPAHDVGNCGKSITVTGSRTCDGFQMGPISISAPAVTGYDGKWSGCDATSPSGASCWMRFYDSGKKSVTLTYTKAVVQAPPVTSDVPCPTPRPTVRMGDKNDCVRRVQDLLNKLINAGLNPDGKFGTNTKNAVLNYQKSKGLTADGIVGNQTWASLESGGTNNTTPVGTTKNPSSNGGGTSGGGSGDSKSPNLPTGNDCSRTVKGCITVDQKTGTTNTPSTPVGTGSGVIDGSAPSGDHKKNEDSKTFDYNGKTSTVAREVRICVSIAPTDPKTPWPKDNTVKTTSGENFGKFTDDTINGRHVKRACTTDKVGPPNNASFTYRVKLNGFWVNLYGTKL